MSSIRWRKMTTCPSNKVILMKWHNRLIGAGMKYVETFEGTETGEYSFYALVYGPGLASRIEPKNWADIPVK